MGRIIQNEALFNEFEPPYNIEFLQVGVWDVIDFTFDWMSALYIASSHAEQIGEGRIRIMDNNGKII